MGQIPNIAPNRRSESHPEALVRVTRTECRGRKENAGGNVPSQAMNCVASTPRKIVSSSNTRRDRESYP